MEASKKLCITLLLFPDKISARDGAGENLRRRAASNPFLLQHIKTISLAHGSSIIRSEKAGRRSIASRERERESQIL